MRNDTAYLDGVIGAAPKVGDSAVISIIDKNGEVEANNSHSGNHHAKETILLEGHSPDEEEYDAARDHEGDSAVEALRSIILVE